jgi:hypothetical protein
MSASGHKRTTHPPAKIDRCPLSPQKRTNAGRLLNERQRLSQCSLTSIVARSLRIALSARIEQNVRLPESITAELV